MGHKASIFSRSRINVPLLTLSILLVAVFLTGGGSRGDVASLVLLRPLAVICLAIGLAGLTREHWRIYRLPLSIMAAMIGLVLLHLIPLPPFIWTNISGRELAVHGDALVGLEGLWRPLTLVPFRGWNSLYSLAVPAAAMVLAVQIDLDKHRTVLAVLLALGALSGLVAITQIATGFSPSLYLYQITSANAPTGLFANKNHFSAMLCILLPVLALFASDSRGRNAVTLQALCGSGAVAILFLVLAAGSRAGVIFFALSLFASLAIWNGRPQRMPSSGVGKRKFLPVLLAAFGLLAALFLIFIFSRADSVGRLVGSDAVEENRFEVWRVIIGFLPDYMPLGSGIGSFVEIFTVHEPSSMLGLAYWNHVHNDWLEWTLEGGIPAAILLLTCIVAWSIRTQGLLRKLHSKKTNVQMGILGATVVLILGLWSLVDYPLRVPSLSCFAALAAVWMTAPVRVHGTG